MATLADIDALLKRGEPEKALRISQRLSRRNSSNPALLDALARSYSAAGDQKKALATYDRLARLVPRSAKPHADKAHLMQQIGELAAAEQPLRRALKLAPLNGSVLRMLSVSVRLSADDPAIQQFVSAWKNGSLPDTEKEQAGYALFKAFGREGFEYLSEANRLQRVANPFDLAQRQSEIDRLQAAFRSSPWPDAGPGVDHRLPIMVTGMPRSGTTLVEQILSSHAQVGATGETGLPLRAVYSVLASGQGFNPVSNIPANELALIAQRYVDGIDHFHSPGTAFTDKSIQSYLVSGLLHHVLPQTRTIFVRRDPRDTGWSIFRNHFESGTHGYSNKLEDIAGMFELYEQMIAFWAKERPDSFIVINYEELVRDPEPQIRKMLDYCGLEWDPACLSPEKNLRKVKTLSIEQVRSPISPNSIGGWRKYARELAPLIDALGDRVREWD